MDYTDEQKEVIETRGENLLVSAAAGSGKTAVLSARILSLLTDEKDPVDIDRMLIVTFTRAAAAEMRERIGKAISAYCAEHPGNRHMERQSTLLNNAQITTIDSFCLFVVKNNFADIELDPGFRILDEGEKQLMLADCLAEMMEEKYSGEDEDFLSFMDSYCSGVKDDLTQKMILELLQNALSDPDPESWLEKAAADIAPVDFSQISASEWYKWGQDKADGMIAELQSVAQEAIDICRQGGELPASYMACSSCIKNIADTLSGHSDYEGRHHIISAASIPALRGKKDKADPLILAAADAKIDEAKTLYKAIAELYSIGAQQLADTAAALGRNAKILCDLCRELKERFDAVKREKGLVDFNDMEHFALKILLDKDMKPTRAAEDYRAHFEHVFVDEYQDSNYVQEYILKSVAREDNYFCVGDVKQSIYSFRQARPELFMEKYREYGAHRGGKRIDLNKNFRSRSQVIDFVNLIFEVIMREDTAGMDYDADARLYVGADYKQADPDAYKTEIDVLLTDEEAPELNAEEEDTEEEDEDDEDEGDSREEMECRMVAGRIKQLMSEGFKVWDKDLETSRPVRYSDIVLLVSSPKPYEKALRNVFGQADIPLYLNASTGYFNAIEVKGLVAALRVIDNPRQDKPLHFVLTAFLEIFDEDEMVSIKTSAQTPSLYDALKLCAAGSSELKEKAETFFAWLKRYREYARFMKVRELIELLLSESGYLDRMSAMPSGAGRRANLKLLIERAADYEQTGYRGLFHFVRYISLLKKQEVDSGEATVLDGVSDMVQCMTIHKSKGLEFPVVICMGFYRHFNKRGRNAAVMTDAGLGIGLEAIDPVARTKIAGIKRRYLAEKKKSDELAEQMRKLYVALTRAREKLIITDVRGKRRDCELKEARGHIIRKADSFNGLIYAALDNSGIAGGYIRYINDGGSSAAAEKELKRAFGDRDLLISDALPVDERLKAGILKGLQRSYSHPDLKGLFTKTSVSELKRAAYEDEEAHAVFESDIREAYVPSFASAEEKRGGAARGSAYHRMLELLDLACFNEKDIPGWIKSCIEKEKASGRLTEEYAQMIDPALIERFLAHDEGRRMIAAAADSRLWREQPFFMSVPAARINPAFPDGENVLIQGVIDAFWQEGDELILLDYKTDRVDGEDELKKRYKIQLELYAEALSRIRGKKVGSKLIYSFCIDRFIYL